MTYCHNSVGADLRQHVRADGVDLRVEIIAERIKPGETALDLRRIAAFQQPKQPLAFFADISSNVVVDRFNPAIDTRQRRIVGLRRTVTNDRIDERARTVRFLSDFEAFAS